MDENSWIDAEKFVDENGIVHRCCVCKKYRNLPTGEFVSLAEWQKPPEEMISDGYCPHCFEKAMAEVRDFRP